ERTRALATRAGGEAGVPHRGHLVHPRRQLGCADGEHAVHLEILDIARSIKHAARLPYAHRDTDCLHQLLRVRHEPLAQPEEESRSSSDHGSRLFQATGIIYGAAGRLLQGQVKPALPVLIKGLEAYRATGAGLALPYYLGLLGEGCTQAAIRVDAERALDEA